MGRPTRTPLALAVVIVGATAATSTHAQGRIEETVIVRGRGEAAFTAPIAVTSLTRQNLTQRGIATADDVAESVPGLSMINDQDPGTNIISLRGATTDRLQQAAIAMVVDGVPLADTELFTLRQFDLARIDVLKGPQGALYGKNAAGGVIAFTSTTPADQSGYARAGVANGNWREIEAAGTVPFPGTWAARLAGTWVAADGWITNRTLNQRVDATETRAARITLAGGLSGDWNARIQFNALQEDGGAAWASSNNVTGPFGGRLAGAALTDPIGDFAGSATRSWYQVNLALDRDFSVGQLSVGLAADTYKKRWDEELDYRPGPLTFLGFPAFPDGIQPIRQPTDVDSLTAQVRWNSPDDESLRWSLGAFLQNTNRVRVDDFGPLNFGAAPPLYRTRASQAAVFGGLSVDLAPTLMVEAQARFDSDSRGQDIRRTGTNTRLSKRTGTFERLQPRVAIAWQPGDDVSLYASYGEAFRTGGFNPAPLPTSVWEATYSPEVTRSLETGIKVRGNGVLGAWRVEAAAFANEVTDFQNYTFIDNNSVTLSVDDVEVQGIEVSAQQEASLDENLQLRTTFGWSLTDATIQRFVAPDPIIAGASRDYSGNKVPNIPHWTGSASAELRLIGETVETSFGVVLNGSGRTVFEIDNALYAPARFWVDARLSARNGQWTASLWAKNVTDERWAISAFGQGMTQLLAFLGPGGPFDTFTINRGRSFGLTLERRFDGAQS